ncbi:phage recombination protein Bet [Methylobacterium aquaticum]|uniref:phage recombination protein Bet n=1 Tax=Methylobacterium aquaticum TaxID=270351 RepID=UPI003D1769E3
MAGSTAVTERDPSISERATPRAALPTIAAPRLPYHPAMQERFGVSLTEWRALVDAVFPLAKEPSSVILALSYCRARNLDPFKKPVHIVPMWNAALNRMVETVWPGIGELRTTAFRTGQYAGRDEAKYGETITTKIGAVEIQFPEWCQVTVYRLLGGQRLPFPGPRVYWRESYATTSRSDASPNAMWRRRPFGQIDKCAEAAALRAAFPEEVGNEYAAEEMEGRTIDGAERRGDPAVAGFQPVANPLADNPETVAHHVTGEVIEDAAAEEVGADEPEHAADDPGDDFPGNDAIEPARRGRGRSGGEG